MSGNSRKFLGDLVAHARSNVWCTPRQDEQAILRLARLTPNFGALRRFALDWNTLDLPESGPYFHVYQIGSNLPSDLGLGGIGTKWERLDAVCKRELLYADLYESDGYHLPLTGAWVCRTDNHNLLVAVRLHQKLPDLNNNTVSLRLYSSAWFRVKNDPEIPHEIRVRGGVMSSVQDIIAVFNEYQSLLDLGRVGVFLYWNGLVVSGLRSNQVAVGDVLEFVYDSSIYRKVSVKLSDLDLFTSIVDKTNKYLLHVPKEQNQQIAYRDDLEVTVYRIGKEGEVEPGLYYHRNNENGLRMVTHNDYAFPVHHVTVVGGRLSTSAPIDAIGMRVYFRHSGYDRPLVFESNRIHELYKLTDTQIRQAMTGLHATLPEWQAANLENSWYTYLMRNTFGDFTSDDVIRAYGYNAMSVLSCMSPHKLLPDSPVLFDVPIGCRGVTIAAYEYKDGVLVGVTSGLGGETYRANSPGSNLVEYVQAVATNVGVEQPGLMWFLDEGLDYRVYRTPSGYTPGGRKWTDVTELDVVVEDGKMVSVSDTTGLYDYCLKSDESFVTYAFDFNPKDRLFKFDVFQYTASGELETMEIPPAKLDLWLNGHPLIFGLDYQVVWPTVLITNKEWLIEGANRVRLRALGFCTEAGELEPVGDFGYVNNGLLSVNNRFNIRDDKSQNYIVYGKLYSRLDLKFSETDSGVYLNNVREGAPYLCSNNWVPIRGVGAERSVRLYHEALELDGRVEDYMSRYLPPPKRPESPGIPDFYKLYSPWFNKLTNDLVLGVVKPEQMVTDKQLLDVTQRYSELLQYEPMRLDVDLHYVNVHPHSSHNVVEVTSQQYDILRRANRLLFGNKLLLSQFYHLI